MSASSTKTITSISQGNDGSFYDIVVQRMKLKGTTHWNWPISALLTDVNLYQFVAVCRYQGADVEKAHKTLTFMQKTEHKTIFAPANCQNTI